MLNQVNIMGRLTQNPVLRQTENGRDVTNITLACSRNYIDQNSHACVDYIDAVLWGTLACTAFQYLSKGDLIVMEGHLRQIKRPDSAGRNIFQLQLVADRIHFTGRNRKTEQAEPHADIYQPFAAVTTQAAPF